MLGCQPIATVLATRWRPTAGGEGPAAPPTGFLFLIDDVAWLLDDDGAHLLLEI